MVLDHEQLSMLPIKDEKTCRICQHFAALQQPFERSDGAVIYGYCFRNGHIGYGIGICCFY